MLQPGHIINETYRVEKLLGSGGMADVYIVTHMRMPRKFALKVMRLESNTRQAFLDRFNQEGEILATIRHPHIVDVIDRNQFPDGNPYLVMELLDGEDLATYLARTGALSVPVALRICSQIGEALEAAHQVGVVHRDLKPSNIFLSKQGQVLNFVKVLDFGIAKMTSAEKAPMTAPAALMGTPAYMSPEQALGQVAKIDARTDQFALAAVLYEMLAGKGAFHQPGDVVYAILERVVHGSPEPLKDPHVNRAVMHALSKKPEDRFLSLREFLAAVGATTHTVYGGSSTVPNNPGTVSSQVGERTLPARRKGFGRYLAGGGVAAGLAAVAIMVTVARKAPKPEPPVLKPAINITPAASPTFSTPPVASPSVSSASAPVVSRPSGEPTEPLRPSTPDPPTASASRLPGGATTPVSAGPVQGGDSKKPDAKPSATSRGHLFAISNNGKAGFIDPVVMACAREQLGSLPLREGTVIKLERSGTLVVVDAPPSVYNTNLNSCLRQGLSRVTHSMIPQVVTLRVLR